MKNQKLKNVKIQNSTLARTIKKIQEQLRIIQKQFEGVAFLNLRYAPQIAKSRKFKIIKSEKYFCEIH